jgi:ABC-2 type transport system permease protein
MNFLRLIWIYVRLGALGELQYRANFFIQLFDSIVKIGAALTTLAVVYSHTPDLGGWTEIELRALVGVFFVVGGLINIVLEPSMVRLMQDVRKGTLDFTLLKPEDSQLLVSFREFELWKLTDVVIGAVILTLSLWQMAGPIGIKQTLCFGTMLLAGGAIVYSFWLSLATLVFWFVKITNILVIFESTYEAGRWPLVIYPGWLRVSLTFIVPVAVAVTIPAEALVGHLNSGTMLAAIAAAVAALALSRVFWTIGVRRYSGASA